MPGRVVWVHDSDSVEWDGKGYWWHQDHFDEAVIQKMVSNGISSLADEIDAQSGWNSLFRKHNDSRGKEGAYQSGEKIAIKANMNGAGACNDADKNIKAVISSVISYHRARKKKSVSDILSCGEVFISISQRTTFVKDLEVELTKIEFDILQYFMSERGRALSYEQIYDTVWNDKYNESSKRAIKTMIKKLRKKLTGDENENIIIENVRGFGYRMPI